MTRAVRTGTPLYVVKLRERLAALPFAGSPFTLLVSGSREAEQAIWGPVLDDLLVEVNRWLRTRPSLTGAGVAIKRAKILRHGGQRGIDTLAHIRARQYGFTRDRMPADWSHWGRRSGIIRNQQMIDKLPRPDFCLALFASISSGTANCAAQAREAGIPTLSVTVEDLYMPHVR